MSSYCRVSENLIVGNNQKGDMLWQHIFEMYEQARADNLNLGTERSIESLKNHCKRLNTNVTKWIGTYKEAYRRKKSRMSNKDVEHEAQALYGKTKFTNQEVFKQVMRHHPKWELVLKGGTSRKHPDDNNFEEDQGSSKRSRTEKDGSDPTEPTPSSWSSSISRPTGRDKAKGKRKEKATTSQSSSIHDKFTAELREMTLVRKEENETAKRKIDAVMLATLVNKSHLTPREEALKDRLMEKLYPD